MNLADNSQAAGTRGGADRRRCTVREWRRIEDLRTAAGARAAGTPTTGGVVKADVAGVVKAGTAIELVKQGFDGTEGPLPLPDGSLVFTENRVDRDSAHRG
mgnify:CR=1 FL=1